MATTTTTTTTAAARRRPRALCAAAVLAAAVLAAAARARECTAADWACAYTACRESSNTRDHVCYARPGAAPCAGGVPCPAPALGLRCDVACGPGAFLPPGTLACAPCAAGSFSVGGGVRPAALDGFPRVPGPAPLAFETRAEGADVSPGGGRWAVDEGGRALRSGAVNDSQASLLLLPLHLVMDGEVSFEYEVEAEAVYDGLDFRIDDTEALPLVSSTRAPQTFRAPLARGYHTLQWRYRKDVTLSAGADAAWLRALEVRGVLYSDAACTPCPPGTYAPAPNASACTPCPRDTFAAAAGATACAACPAAEYALEGAAACAARPPCTAADVEARYGACAWDAGLGAFVRAKTYAWRAGTTCATAEAALPPAEAALPCEPCNAGAARSRVTGACEFCAPGSAAAAGAAACRVCAPGSEAQPGLFVSRWNDGAVADPLGLFATECDGSCGTPGWTVDPDTGAAVSGAGHGGTVTATLEMRFGVSRPATVAYTYSLYADALYGARLQVSLDGATVHTHWAEYVRNTTASAATVDVPVPGNHTLAFAFMRRSAVAALSTDHATLHNVSAPAAYALGAVPGAPAAGGAACVPCAVGHISTDAAGNAWCVPCEPGTSTSGPASTFCVPCAADTFAPTAGSACRACGAGTHTSSVGAERCDDPCGLVVAGGGDAEYDLSGLAARGAVAGPATDATAFRYFVRVCEAAGAASDVCVDGDGTAVAGWYACQKDDCDAATREGRPCIDRNTGAFAGYALLPPEVGGERDGFVAMYTGGAVGCDGLERSTNITFLCDPAAGNGVPRAPDGRTIEGPPCHYELVWATEHACPLCTDADIAFQDGACENNARRRTYYWRENPRRCHGGISLPDDVLVPANCSSRAICPPGHYADPNDVCTACPAGTASPGAGVVLDLTTTDNGRLPAALVSSCTGPQCAPFAVQNGLLWAQAPSDATQPGTTVLRYATQFLVNGSTSFSWALMNADAHSSLTFAVDGATVFAAAAALHSSGTHTANITAGAHTLVWTLSYVSAGTHAALSDISTHGNAYAPTACTPCPAGTHSGAASGAICTRCPVGTVPTPDRTQCQKCPTGSHTPDGRTCVTVPQCTEADWARLYTPCVNGTRTAAWRRLAPAVCTGGFTPEDVNAETVTDCAPCPTGMWRNNNSDVCTGCAQGLVFNGDTCAQPYAGSVALHTLSFFVADGGTEEQSLPDGWTTTAHASTISAGAAETLGWRVLPDMVDAGTGVDGHTVVTTLAFAPTSLTSDGYVSFDYRVPDDSDSPAHSTLQFFVAGTEVSLTANALPNGFLRSQTVSFRDFDFTAMAEGTPALAWVAVLTGATATPIAVQNVRIGGLEDGTSVPNYCAPGTAANAAATVCTLCAPGTAANTSGSPCRPCPTDTYASRSGVASCRACYPGSSTDPKTTGATHCRTSCIFDGAVNGTTTTYNLTALRRTVVGPVAGPTGDVFYFSVCDGVLPAGTCAETAQETRACRTDSARTAHTSFGSELEFAQPATAASEEDLAFVLTFHDGDLADSTSADDSNRLRTTLIFRCSEDAGVGFPQYLSYSDATRTATFAWASLYACHACTEDDYELVVSECRHSRQRRELHRVRPCVGEDRILLSEEACTDIAVPASVVAAAGAVVLALLAGVAFVVYKNRKITYKYTKLLQDHGAADMESFADANPHMDSAMRLAQDEERESIGRSSGTTSDSDSEGADDYDDYDDDGDDGEGVGHVAK